jgi:putative hemolysin
MEYSYLIIVFTLLFSAFFSAVEIAFISSNRLKVELDRSKGTFTGKILGYFYTRESRFIAMLLLGNNVVLVIFGIYAALMLQQPLGYFLDAESASMILSQTIISTIAVLIIAEFLPKALVQINPNYFLRFAAFPVAIIYWLLYIPTQIVLSISNLILTLFNVKETISQKVFSKVDLEHYVNDLNERLNDEEEFGNEMQILQNALDFSSVRARNCMIPRPEMVAIDVDEELSVLKQLFVQTGLSKILVYRGSIDHIIGYVHSFEMFKNPESIKQILLPIAFVPEAIPGKELLELFAKQSGNIAVVVDEYGGTSGIITIEDVIEEIFGEIEDEHDVEDWKEEVINENTWRFSARADIDYLNSEYHLNLPESDVYDTLGGLLIYHFESIPENGAVLELDDFTMIIEEVSDRRIELVRLERS